MWNFYKSLVRPVMFGLDAERAHELGIESLRIGLSSEAMQRVAMRRFTTPFEPVERFGLTFSNPLGVAAGFDKNGIVVNELASLGFGFVEVGTVTYEPQKGNERPRLFRLPDDGALVNRLGFNNDGALAIAERLRKLRRKCVVGVNIGKNKDVPNEEAVENYLACFDVVRDVADYIAVNISSPNTPGLRELQRGAILEKLIGALIERSRSSAPRAVAGKSYDPESRAPDGKPLLVKIAPDLTEGEIEEIVDICLRLRVSGIIATNTTVSRDGLKSPDASSLGAGGLSGRPLRKRSNEVIRSIYRRSGGRLPIIGVGGIFTAEDAFDKIAAGASLLQAYTGFVYSGPSFARRINLGLLDILKERGFSRLDDAVGTTI